MAMKKLMFSERMENSSAQGAAPGWEKMRNESLKRENYQMEMLFREEKASFP